MNDRIPRDRSHGQARRSRRIDRRQWLRKEERRDALVGPKRHTVSRCENAVIEESGEGGLRIRSAAPVHRKETLVLYVGEKRRRMKAKVVWVKQEGLIEKRLTGKPCRAFVAGCLVKEAEGEQRFRRESKIEVTADKTARVVRGAIITAGIGLAGAVAYFVASLVHLIR